MAIAALAFVAQSCEPVPNLDQRTYVSGVVCDAATGLPIQGCQVFLSRIASSKRVSHEYVEPVAPGVAITDSLGKYEFTHLYMGKYHISALAGGYRQVNNIVITAMEEPVVVNFELEKEE